MWYSNEIIGNDRRKSLLHIKRKEEYENNIYRQIKMLFLNDIYIYSTIKVYSIHTHRKKNVERNTPKFSQ